MSNRFKEDFPRYIKSLRENLKMNPTDVERATKKLFPELKEFHITDAYIALIEQGKSHPSYKKIKALAKVYGEDTERMLYMAGYREEEPATGPKDWSKDILRDRYLSSLAQDRTKGLTELEKRYLEKALSEIIGKVHEERAKPNKGDLLLLIFRNLYLDAVACSKQQKPLKEEQKLFLDKFIEDYMHSLSHRDASDK
jgi:transcriptional regulator with XRE-family HTH domain